jgi:hypothetical protein
LPCLLSIRQGGTSDPPGGLVDEKKRLPLTNQSEQGMGYLHLMEVFVQVPVLANYLVQVTELYLG